MAGTDHRPRRVLSVRDQLTRVRGMYPEFWSVVRGAKLLVEGDFRPTERSVVYRVRIEYEVTDSPQVWVVSPKLEPREPGGELKHVYPGDRLCLYLPGGGEWGPDKSIAHTIIPWISEWLFHHEVWLATGEWCGGGVEPRERRPYRRGQVAATEGGCDDSIG